MKNNATSRNNASFLKSIRNTVLISGIGLSIGLLPSCKKADNPSPAAVPVTSASNYGSIQYTLKNHAGTFTRTQQLSPAAICSIGKESTISFQDNDGHFAVGIIKAGALTENSTYYQMGSAGCTPAASSTATYNWKDAHTGIVTSMLFEEGESTIREFHPTANVVKVAFSYTLHDPNFNNELVSVEGTATLNKIVLPVGTSNNPVNASL